MCGRFIAAYDADKLAHGWDARVSSSLPPTSWNTTPIAGIQMTPGAADGRQESFENVIVSPF